MFSFWLSVAKSRLHLLSNGLRDRPAPAVSRLVRRRHRISSSSGQK